MNDDDDEKKKLQNVVVVTGMGGSMASVAALLALSSADHGNALVTFPQTGRTALALRNAEIDASLERASRNLGPLVDEPPYPIPDWFDMHDPSLRRRANAGTFPAPPTKKAVKARAKAKAARKARRSSRSITPCS